MSISDFINRVISAWPSYTERSESEFVRRVGSKTNPVNPDLVKVPRENGDLVVAGSVPYIKPTQAPQPVNPPVKTGTYIDQDTGPMIVPFFGEDENNSDMPYIVHRIPITGHTADSHPGNNPSIAHPAISNNNSRVSTFPTTSHQSSSSSSSSHGSNLPDIVTNPITASTSPALVETVKLEIDKNGNKIDQRNKYPVNNPGKQTLISDEKKNTSSSGTIQILLISAIILSIFALRK